MNANTAFDLAGFAHATEERNAQTLLESYAEDAEVTVIDRNHPPKSPQVLKGREAIRPWLEDTHSRDMTHEVVDPVVGEDRIALTTRQNVVQVWDE